ncbi:MAG: Helix-turn-helix domain [Moraxellaceae bacterium]|jgi:hypothetical protein|nr:Helix-turn-helix domain [Moraxellaceae bacterium]
MTQKKKATGQGGLSQNIVRLNSTATPAQHARLLAYWLTHDCGLNRYEADRLLNVCHLAGRVQDLEAKGCFFTFADETAPDLQGRLHNGIRRYWLKSAPAHLLRAANDEGATP